MADALLGDLLRQVSRSFYLSLAILPRSLREPIGLAYLLARAADTVADTRLIARAERIDHLRALRRACAGETADLAPVAAACAPLQAHAAERTLLERAGEALARLSALPAGDRAAVRAVLGTITDGMLFDLTRFPGEDTRSLAALQTDADLDHYTYLVAGCVGEFWTDLHVAHRPRLRDWDRGAMRSAGVRFGKALQMTNVLRDVPSDLRQGRCYLPAQALAPLGLEPKDLLEPSGALRARPLLDRLLGVTLAHYDAAWGYTLAIPRAEWRMRLACAWPLLIGLATLGEIAAHPNPLAAERPIKISRGAVRAILARSTVTVASDRALRGQAARLRARVGNATG
ncbi:MAG TPA: phytoene/squalene synthase family protein [Methylomirabilota bacterium]|jgi:farnesyl-diphosphate farnesyltransferase|nr:phytoene/squalene synthase family protein [Methylomirabilota bacterium]